MFDFAKPTRLAAAMVALSALAFSICPCVSIAADKAVVNEKFADLEPGIKMMREEAGQDRRQIVKANMLLTETEAAKFWPLYDSYRDARAKLGDRKVRMITDFAASENSMSQDEATRLTKQYFSIEKDKIKVKEAYVAKMSKVLSARTVARFFQIDQKLDAIVDVNIAANVPLIH